MKTVRLFLEACLMVLMGTFMAVLAQSHAYWQFLNPKYSWLTFTTGIVIIVLGLGGLFQTERPRKMSEITAIGIFLGLAYLSLISPAVFMEEDLSLMDSPGVAAGGSLTRSYEDIPAAVDIKLDGKSYVRINVAELLLKEGEDALKVASPYVLQGAVVRTDAFDKAGYIGVGRLLVSCCFADATGVVYPVKVDNPEQYRKGAWVRAFGSIRQHAPLTDDLVHVTGALTAISSDVFSLEAVRVEEVEPEGIPFIFDMRRDTPYAY